MIITKGQKIVTNPSAFSVSINKITSTSPSSIQKSLENDIYDSNHLQYPDYTCL
ncbi:MAG: hypothetical protein ACYDEJ_03815 [Desulfitobacteriaceae bacterium]